MHNFDPIKQIFQQHKAFMRWIFSPTIIKIGQQLWIYFNNKQNCFLIQVCNYSKFIYLQLCQVQQVQTCPDWKDWLMLPRQMLTIQTTITRSLLPLITITTTNIIMECTKYIIHIMDILLPITYFKQISLFGSFKLNISFLPT